MLPLTTIVLPKKLGVEDRRDVAAAAPAGAVGDERDVEIWLGGRLVEPLEERSVVRVEERPVGVERAVLDRDRDLVVLDSGRVAGRWRRAREDAADCVARAPAQEVEAGGAGVDVRARHPDRVVVVPHGRRGLVVGVLKDGAARRPRLPVPRLGLRPERVVVRADGGVAGRDVVRRGQKPGLGKAVALLARVAAMQVGDDRHRPHVRGRVNRFRVGAAGPAGRIRPMQRLVDRQQMPKVVAVRVDELIHPLDADRRRPLRLDRESRVVEACRVVDGAVAPDRRRLPHAPGKDVLLELPHGDLVVVDRLSASPG